MLTKILGGATLISVAGLALVFWLLLQAKEDNGKLQHANAGLQQAVETTANRMAEYALDVEGEISAYETAQQYLLENYQNARDEAEQTKAVFANHDFAKLLNTKPGLVRDRANAATRRLLADIESASRGATAGQARSPETPTAAKAGPD